jgi:hypothetical protein
MDSRANAKNQANLRKALELIKAGKAASAKPLLVDVLRSDDNNFQAWFLLSYTVDDSEQQRTALMKAVAANPNFERARSRLEALGFAAPPPAPVSPPPQPATTPTYTPPTESGWEYESEPKSATPQSFDEMELSFKERDPDRVAFALDEPAPSTETTVGGDSWPIEPIEDEPTNTGGLRRILLVLVGLAALAAAYIFIAPQINLSFPSTQATQPAATAVPSLALPPTWTPAAPESEEAAAQPTTAVVEFRAVDPAAQAQIDTVAADLAAMRGLATTTPIESVLVPADQMLLSLADIYLTEQSAQQLSADEMVLAALGLLNPGEFLTDHELSSYADPYGGYYVPEQGRIYLVGSDLTGAWQFVYARLFGAALAMQNHPLPRLQANGGCPMFDDACRAQRALLLGDGMTAAQLWLQASSDPTLGGAVAALPTDPRLVQSQVANAFVLQDLEFASTHGAAFVDVFFNAAGWENVELVYQNPPVSSEQILHPEAYVATETPLPMSDASFASVLGNGWSPLASGSLGEWLTRLMLSSGAVEEARVSASVASTAAEGWGGDQMQAYLRGTDSAVAAAVHWTMDSETDATQLASALRTVTAARFAGEGSALGGGECWVTPAASGGAGTRACLFLNGADVLWLSGPDEIVVLQVMLAQYPQFAQ